MKRGFLVLHDYGMGGMWAYILAESKDQVRREFPDFKVVSERPSWMTDQVFADIKERLTLDIDEADSDIPLARILKGRHATG